MKIVITCASLAVAAALSTSAADAKGCIKGALIGGAAGHFVHHHGLIGAAVGCWIGRHEANKRAREEAAKPAGENGQY